ncbi:MAG: hypothetical protein H0W48_15580, partial [Methylibium sp.]|nr:hypothetical protein [Methylibium sp.]
WSSLSYTGTGALVGVAVLLLGVPVYWLAQRPARALPAAAGGAALQSVRERR